MIKKNLDSSLINNVLYYINPKIPITDSHYVQGTGLAIFASLTQIEKCLTNFTNKCKDIDKIM